MGPLADAAANLVDDESLLDDDYEEEGEPIDDVASL
jgi:hypothetical protein